MEVVISGQIYSIGRLSARQQFHIARRLAPLIKGLGEVVAKAGGIFSVFDSARRGEFKDKLLSSDPFSIAQPMIDALSAMPDDDVNYILDNCLSVVKRKIGDVAWGPVQVNGLPQYEDMDWLVTVQVAQKVIEGNLVNFTRATA